MHGCDLPNMYSWEPLMPKVKKFNWNKSCWVSNPEKLMFDGTDDHLLSAFKAFPKKKDLNSFFISHYITRGIENISHHFL